MKSQYIYINDNVNVQLTKHWHITATKEDLHVCTDSWSSYSKILSRIKFLWYFSGRSVMVVKCLWLSGNK